MRRHCLVRNYLLSVWLGVGLIAFLTACSSNRMEAITEKKNDSAPSANQGAKKEDAEKAAAKAPPKDRAVAWKPYAGKVGDRIRVTREEKSVTDKVANFLGKDIPSTTKSERTVIHVTEILEAGKNGARPTKLRRIFEKAEDTQFGKVSKMPLHGKSVIVEKKGDTYAFTFEEGGSVTGPSTSEFEGEFNRNLDLVISSLLAKTSSPAKPGT